MDLKDRGVGAAAVWRQVIRKETLPSEASIYTAELYAVNMAIGIIKENKNENFVIISDSRSVLSKMRKGEEQDTMMRCLQHQIYDSREEGQRVALVWIPGHVDLGNNEIADRAAKEAAGGIPTLISIPYSDYQCEVKKKVEEKWNEEWRPSGNKMVKIKENAGKWKKRNKVK